MEEIIKLSIFPSVSPLPQTKADKADAAKQATIPEVVDIGTEEDLIRVVTSYVYSPSVFTGKRAKSNFKSCDFAVLDIDSGMTIEEAEAIISEANFTCLCMPSMSHTEEHHRFRLIFPLVKTIRDVEEYVATMEDLYEAFPQADRSCITDEARLYFPSNDVDGFWIEGDLLTPVVPPKKPLNRSRKTFDHKSRVTVKEDIKELITELYGESRDTIPEAVAYFLENGHTGLEGEWITTVNACVFVLALQGVDFDTVYDIISFIAPNELDARDEATIERAYKDGENSREEEYLVNIGVR